jgi:hypothetical protein
MTNATLHFQEGEEEQYWDSDVKLANRLLNREKIYELSTRRRFTASSGKSRSRN